MMKAVDTEVRRVLPDTEVAALAAIIDALQPPSYTKDELLAKFSTSIHHRIKAGVSINQMIGVFEGKGFRITRADIERVCADAAARQLERKKGLRPGPKPKPKPAPLPDAGPTLYPDPVKPVAATPVTDGSGVSDPADTGQGGTGTAGLAPGDRSGG